MYSIVEKGFGNLGYFKNAKQNYYFFEQTGAHHYAAGVFPGNFASYIAAGNRQLPFRKKNLVDSTSTYF